MSIWLTLLSRVMGLESHVCISSHSKDLTKSARLCTLGDASPLCTDPISTTPPKDLKCKIDRPYAGIVGAFGISDDSPGFIEIPHSEDRVESGNTISSRFDVAVVH